MNSKGKNVKWLPVSTKPKESFSQGGGPVPKVPKKSVKTTSMPSPKTPVKKAGSGFAGSGGPLASGFKKITKGDVVNAALTVTALPGSGQVTKAVAGKVGGFVAGKTFGAASRGLSTAAGAGGKIKTVSTPFGKTVAGTKIGSKAEQSARIGNLLKNAEKTAEIAGSEAAKSVVRGAKLASTAKPAVAGAVAKQNNSGKGKPKLKKK